MMKLKDFTEVAELVRMEARRMQDEPTRLDKVSVQVHHDGARNRFHLSIEDGVEARMSEWAALQLFQKRLGIPYEFLRERCSPALAQQIIDHFKGAEQPRALLVRLVKGREGLRVRAVLPASFARFDNTDLLDVAREVADGAGLKVEHFRVDAESFYCRLLFPQAVDAGTEGRPDPHHFGVFLRNSEVGMGVPEAQFTVVRQVCGNGALGITDEPLMRLHASSLHSVRRGRLVERFREGLEEGLKRRGVVVETIRRARNRMVKLGDLTAALKAIHHEHGLSLRNLDIVREAYHREVREAGGGGASVFTLASALNRAAQHLPGEEAIRYETAAWRYLARNADN